MKTTQTQSKATFSTGLLGRVARYGIVPLLAIALTACQDTDQVGDLETIDETGAAQDDFGTAGVMDDRIVAVNITDDGEVIPEVSAGRAMFRISNEGTEDCSLQLVQTESAGTMGMSGARTNQEDAMLDEPAGDNTDAGTDITGTEGAEGTERDPLSPGTEGTQDDPLTDTDELDGDAYGESGRTDASADAAQQGTGADGTQTVQAGQEATISLDLQPGVYEITCEGTGEQADQVTGQREPMKVLVSDASMRSQPNDETMQDGLQDRPMQNEEDASGTVGAVE